MLPEGEKHWGGPVVIGEDNLPSLVRIGLTDLQNIREASGPPTCSPGSGTTDIREKAISILAGNLNSGPNYLITTVFDHRTH